jgi:poly(3-hydroxybutyrate) depolymerase
MAHPIFIKPDPISNPTIQQKIERCQLLEPLENVDHFIIGDRTVNRLELYVNEQTRYYHSVYPSGTSSKPTSLIIWLHGSRQDALITSIYSSNLIENVDRHNYCLALPQAFGERKAAHQHSKYLDISFGKMYWEVRDQIKQFDNDKQFISDIIDREGSTNPSIHNVYLLGFSNGGVFACLMAVHLRDRLTAAVSFAGGIGHDAHTVIDPGAAPSSTKPIRLILVTGKDDSHYQPTLAAKNIFEDFDYEPELFVVDGLAHKYRLSEEEMVMGLLFDRTNDC